MNSWTDIKHEEIFSYILLPPWSFVNNKTKQNQISKQIIDINQSNSDILQ